MRSIRLGAFRAAQPAAAEAVPIAAGQPIRLKIKTLTALGDGGPRLVMEPGTRLHAAAIRPALLSGIGLLAREEPRPRSQVTVPLCPTGQASDTVLYQDPRDPAKHYFLPRYELKTVDGKAAMHIHKRDAGWRLSIDLRYLAAPELGDVGAATELPHELAVILRYRIGPTQRELALAWERDPDLATTHATLDIAKEAELDEIIAALTDPALGAQLIARRAAMVALPVAEVRPIASARTATILTAQPLLRNAAAARVMLLARRLPDGTAGGAETPPQSRPPREPPPWHQPPREPPPWHVLPPRQGPPPPPPEPQYRETTVSLDYAERELFVFSRERYGYVYSDVEGGSADVDMKLYYVPFGGIQHRYYRDPQAPSVFNYLPDAFKLSRRPDPPHEPSLIVRYIAGTHGLDDMKVELSFVAMPYTDPARLQDAARALPAMLDDPLPAGTEPSFVPLSPPPENLSVALSLPGGGGAASYRRLDGARVELPTLVCHTLELTLEEFKRIYEALLGAVSVLFKGSVSVTFPDWTQPIPLDVRVDDMVGPVFDEIENPGTTEGAVHLTLRNAIESPVTFSGVSAQLVVGKTPHPANVFGIDAAAPIDLAPGAAIEMEIVPAERVGGEVEDAVLDFAAFEVKPDAAKIYQAILDATAPQDYLRAITVRGTQFFAAAQGTPVAVLVEFEHGSTAELTPDKRDADAVVSQPLADYVLANVVTAKEPKPGAFDLTTATYRYKVTVIAAGGARAKSPDWIEDTSDILYPVPPPVPVTP